LTSLIGRIVVGAVYAMETPAPALRVTVPFETEVLREHREMVTGTRYEEKQGIIAEMDVRQVCWQERMGLPAGTKVHWADVRTEDIRELSALPWPITYRLTYGDPWYKRADGGRQYVSLQKHLGGIDLERKCTVVGVRAAVLLAVMAGVGLRCVCWLMKLLFHLEVTKSSLDRWVKECAAQLPDAGGMARALHQDKPITEASFDEIFAKGQCPKRCTLVLRDEHGRIFAVKQVEERNTKTVAAFLEEVKGWGLAFKVFYVDGCEAYRAAIAEVFPQAVVQYDYFHVIQNIWRKLWKAVVARRKELKAQAESPQTTPPATEAKADAESPQTTPPATEAKADAESPQTTPPATEAKADAEPPQTTPPVTTTQVLGLAKRIWEHRYVFFKRDEHLTPKEKQELPLLLQEEPFLARVRGFVKDVWDLFQRDQTEQDAERKLAALKTQVAAEPKSPFAKSVAFLESRFSDMVAFLRHPTFVRRNSLAETGIRCLRRLEQGHDGFRGAAGLDRYLRLYQAVKYCGWTVHRFTPELGLPPALVLPAVHLPDSPSLSP
jgi:transposase-like protein